MKRLATILALSALPALAADEYSPYPAGEYSYWDSDGANVITVTTNAQGYILSTKKTLVDVARPAIAEIVFQTEYEDGTTNSWTQADLVDALGLMNRKYHRDMASESGRVAWHGRRLQQYAMTNGVGRLQVVSVYADGYAHTEEAKAAKVADPEAAAKLAAENARLAAEAKARQEATLAAWEAANLPAEIAALRAAQRAAAVTNEVTVITTPAN